MLRQALRPLALTVAMATVYLGLADVAAFNNGIFEVAEVIGRDRVLARLDHALPLIGDAAPDRVA